MQKFQTSQLRDDYVFHGQGGADSTRITTAASLQKSQGAGGLETNGRSAPDIYLKMIQSHENYESVDGQLKNASPEVLRRRIELLMARQNKYRSIFETITQVSKETNFDKAIRTLFQSSQSALHAKHATLYVFPQISAISADGKSLVQVAESTWLTTESQLESDQVFRNKDLLQGKFFNMFNVQQSEEFLTTVDERYAGINMECVLSVPIVAPKSQQTIGILEFINKSVGAPYFEPEDESLLRLLSNFWVYVLSNAYLKDGSSQNHQMTQSFSDIASALQSNQTDLDGLIDGLQAATCRLISCEIAEFCTVDRDANVIRSFKPSEYNDFQIPLDSKTIPGKWLGRGVEILYADFLTGHVIETCQLLNSYDPKSDLRFGTEEELAENYSGIRNVLCVPLRDSIGVVTGVVQVINKVPESASFDREDEELLGSFAYLVTSVIERSRVMIGVEQELGRMNQVNKFFSSMLTGLPYIVMAVDSEMYLVSV